MEFTKRPLIGEISQADAQKMVAAFPSPANDPNYTKSVWFSLEQMDQLVTLLKSEKLMGAETDGVRIYFARYVDGLVPPPPAEYKDRNTVIFVSTKAVGRAQTADNQETTFHEDYFTGLSFPAPNEAGGDGSIKMKTSGAENRGELCQPRCQGVTLP
ncbi:hypothetical protein IDJ77_01085 [Mucilaginibacter sp. ZT4R22]|uniref:Uncharacterized protein n=1 Tax=Mucilaginibacter pankratovii TaxID=2772110 RepID=A0ABR7WM01_9SPHI|nr:hypothetical protein [Mucilaginibacter pankratovii]MBD1362389.1 hypothetical protein [Mucilaginibacter pankratovii]